MSLFTERFKKYNVPGPRYTSYPTVPYWESNPTEAQWLEGLRRSFERTRLADEGASIYIHIPFCRQLCTYCGCNTRISRNPEVGTAYVKTVLREWELYREKIGLKEIPLSEIHLGGGTPTFLSPQDLRTLIEGVVSTCQVRADREFSLEADPRVTTREHLETMASLGFTRLSLGIQDFDPRVQEIVHRVQSEEQVREVTETARALGFNSINFDLIYGLPLQTLESVRGTIEKVMRLRPDRIAFYAYAHVPWIKPGQRRFTEADLPSGDEKRALFELGRELLEKAGYREVGMDHFALEEDSLFQAAAQGKLHRNFMGYTSRHVDPLIGLGVSAIGDSWDVFAQNEKSVESYTRKVEAGELPLLRGHVLTSEDEVLRRHILNLMTRFHTSWEGRADYVPYLDSVPERLRELMEDGLVTVESRGCRISEEGKPFLRNICMAFDARLTAKAPGTQLFSKTI